jgi:hypothetical protein
MLIYNVNQVLNSLSNDRAPCSDHREILVLFVSIILLLTTAIVFSSFFASNEIKSAFGDGLTQEQLTASLGNRKDDLPIKMILPVVTTKPQL